MKRFLRKVLIWISILLLISVIPAYFIDPYNVFHWEHIRNNGIEPNKNYIKTKYLLKNPEKYDSVLLGSSRVGAIHVEKAEGLRLYNMTYSSGTPQENLETLTTLLEGDVDIHTVYLGVDSQSYTENIASHYSRGHKCPYQYLTDISHLISLYCNPAMILQSIPAMKNGGNVDVNAFYEYGWWCEYDQQSTYDWSSARATISRNNYMEDTLNSIEAIRNICQEKGISLIVFTNPMCELTFRASVDADYYQFLRRLAAITEYYNFSAINRITCDNGNYLDTSHYNAYVGDILIDAMFHDDVDQDLFLSGFGWIVSSQNVDDLISVLESSTQ